MMATRLFAAIVAAGVLALAGAATPAQAQSSLCSVQWPSKPGTYYAAVCGIGPIPARTKPHHHRHHRSYSHHYGKLVSK